MLTHKRTFFNYFFLFFSFVFYIQFTYIYKIIHGDKLKILLFFFTLNMHRVRILDDKREINRDVVDGVLRYGDCNSINFFLFQKSYSLSNIFASLMI